MRAAVSADDAAAQAAAQAIGPRASAWVMNVSSAEAVDRTFAAIERKVGPADILVTSAGVPGHGALADLTDELWHDVLGINLNGVFYCMRAALRQMLPRRSGAIVNVSSNKTSRQDEQDGRFVGQYGSAIHSSGNQSVCFPPFLLSAVSITVAWSPFKRETHSFTGN